jgi:hypothetical protein
MASYHTSFTYLGKNSAEQGYIIAVFEPDEGFKDTFLGMDQISEDYYDGTKKFLYGTRYNSTATITITLIKMNGTDFTVNDNRNALRWLTGSRVASWLDLYQGDNIKYSFLGTVTSVQQYKLDGRVVGIQLEFSSITPWAFSAPQVFDCLIGQLVDIVDDGVMIKLDEETEAFSIDDGGVLSFGGSDVTKEFKVTDDGLAYIDNQYRTHIDNASDDLYTYIYLDIDYQNENGTYVSIKNATLQEESLIKNISANESISISAKQFIVSDIPNKLFGDDFNFVWPRLQPGDNDFIIDGDGRGSAQFTYRYPMKVGDCAMDIDVYGSDAICNCPDDTPSSDAIQWQDITGKPTTIAGYGIEDAYTESEIDDKIEEINEKIDDIEISGGTGGSVTIDEEELNEMLKDLLF